MAKKKGSKYSVKAAVSEERVAELQGALDTGTLEGVSDAEFAALAARLAEDEAVERLLTLQQRASGKTQKKAVNQALYRLEQRGISLPGWRERAPGIDLAPAAESVADLPVLAAEPFTSGARYFLLPYQSGRTLLLLSVQLVHPTGLETLRSAETGRAGYRSLVKRMVQEAVLEGRPTAAHADDRLRQRKLWEIGRCIREGRIGAEVDHQLVAELRWPEEPPPHPALDLALDDAEPLGREELSSATRMAAAFLDDRLWERLQTSLAEARATPLILSEQTEAERVNELRRRVIDETVDEWHLPSLVELFLDTALFHALTGGLREARTLRDVVAGLPEERAGESIRRFLSSWLGAFSIPAHESVDEPDPGGGGLLIP
jgi:hypothetical protein